jgi:rare lipoprotein A
MRRFLLVVVFSLAFLPSVAAVDAVTRRDGFLMMWEAIKRPAEATRETPYIDVPKGAPGHLEITYAKARGLLSDESPTFRPDEALTVEEALVMLLRTRNVADPDEITPETLPAFLKTYPVAHLDETTKSNSLSTEDFRRIMQMLDQELRDEDHEASLYAEKFHGKGTAFGEAFDMYALTAAHRTFPSNTLVKVTNIANGKSVIVRINDRGPYVAGRDMDLSLAAFTSIAERSKGKIRVRFERLGDFRLVDETPRVVDGLTPSVQKTVVTATTTISNCNDLKSSMQRRVSGGVALTPGIPTQLVLGSSISLESKKAFVVRGVSYPDGTNNDFQDWVMPGETFTFKPSVAGMYMFEIGSKTGRPKSMKMEVVTCD